MNQNRRFEFRRIVLIPLVVAFIATLVVGAVAPTTSKALNSAALGLYQEPYFPHTTFESWLGRPVTYALGFANRSTWGDIDGSTQTVWLTGAQNWKAGSPSTRRLIYAMAMVPESGTSPSDIAACAAGTHNARYSTLATQLVSRNLQNTVIRLAWEMNGSWFPGGYAGNNATSWNNWKNCWIQVVTTMRGVPGQQFTFDFNPNIGYSESGTFFSSYYPGDAYVDVISLDVYDFHYNVCGSSFTARWNNLLTQPGGLNDFAAFATAHNKPMAFDEWGLWGTGGPHCGGGDDPQYIDAMADWFENHNVAWQTYFNVLADSDHRLDTYPNSKARYKARFGTSLPTNTPTNTPLPGATTGYEAEAGTFGGGGAIQSATNASGGQVIGALNNVGAYSQINSVNGGAGGSATLVVRYANGYTTSRSLSLYVNGVDVAQLTFPVTGSWNTFQNLTTTITLNAGTANTIKLQRDSADVAAADIDKYTLTTTGVGPTSTPTLSPTPGSGIFPLKVSSNHRYLVRQDGTTAYYPIADTAWMIYWSVSREDAELYLENRRLKGFNTINTSALPMPDIASTNVYGNKPFIGDNMATPNDAYFAHVDWVINKAAEKGLNVMLGPAWAQDYTDNLDATKARSFGRYMGNRYKNFDNIIWFMGGDVYAPTANQLTFAREMAAGIQEFDTRHLITYHPGGLRSSSIWFHNDSWLAFNTIQTYDPASTAAYSMVLSDYNLSPVKPTWNMEPNYENENSNTPYNVRLAAGWSAFSGGFGVSYGSPIWRMGTVANWQNNLNLTGTGHFTNIGKAIQARAFEKLVPDQSHTMLTVGYGSGSTFASAARASDGSFGMAYLPTARAITINMTQFNSSKTIKWFDPTNNTYTTVGTFANTGTQSLAARPNNSAGQADWILVIE